MLHGRIRCGSEDRCSIGTLDSKKISRLHWIAGIKTFPHGSGEDLLVPKLHSSGISDPHCTTLQTVWNSKSQKTRITNSTSRVNNGNRTRYDRTRDGLKGSGGKAVGVAMIQSISTANSQYLIDIGSRKIFFSRIVKSEWCGFVHWNRMERRIEGAEQVVLCRGICDHVSTGMYRLTD